MLFLDRDLLLDLAPGADFEAAAHPAQRFIASAHGFRVANNTFRGFLDPVRFHYGRNYDNRQL
jgi:hypothetical protein